MKHSTISTNIQFLTDVAQSLFLFTKTDSTFAASLQQSIRIFVSQPDTPQSSHPAVSEVSVFLMPNDREEAEARWQWLLNETTHLPLAQQKELTALLYAWSDTYESPKDLAIGIIGVAIWGPTLGIVKKRKKQKSQMQILVDKNIYQKLSPAEKLDLTTQASLQLLAKTLQTIQGDTNRLDPDFFDWLYSDNKSIVGTLSSTQLHEAKTTLDIDRIPHHCLATEKKIHAIAIAPIANSDLLQELNANPI